MTKLGRSLVFALVVLLLLSGVAIADYLISTVVGDVTVWESLTVTPTSFAVSLFPNSRVVKDVVVRNNGSTLLYASAVAVVEPSDNGVTVDLGRLTVVEPLSEVVVPVVVTIANDAVPGKYLVTVTVERDTIEK